MWQLRGLQLVLNFLGNQFDIQPILKGTSDCAMVTIWGESSSRNSFLFDSDRVRYFGQMGISAQWIFPAAGNLMNGNRNVVLCNRQTSLVSNEEDIKVEMGKKLLTYCESPLILPTSGLPTGRQSWGRQFWFCAINNWLDLNWLHF